MIKILCQGTTASATENGSLKVTIDKRYIWQRKCSVGHSMLPNKFS